MPTTLTHPLRRVGTLAMVVILLIGGGLVGCATQVLAPTTRRSSQPTEAPGPSTQPTPDGSDFGPGYSAPVADSLYPAHGNPGVDVLSYQLQLTWAPATRVLTGTATLAIRATRPLTELSVDFLRAYTVDSATVDERPVSVQRPGDRLVAPAPTGLGANGRTTLVVRYHGQPGPVPFPSSRSDAAEGLGLRATAEGELWTMQEPYGAYTWYPVNDQPSDKATYDISVSVPGGWAAVAGGTPAGVTAVAGGVHTYRWTSALPVASYLTTLAVGRYTEVTETGPGGLPVTYWLRTGRDEPLRPALAKTPALLSWLEERYGPYPFPTGGVLLVDSVSAMETQQMVTIGGMGAPGSGPVNPQSFEQVLLHELSHQWFGDCVTPRDWVGLWLSEGWAMYSEWMWSVDQGRRTDAQWVRDAVRRDQLSRRTAGPAGHPRPGAFAENNVYLGPALLLREIRLRVGDQEFFAMARDWVQTQRYQSVDRAGFTAFVNTHTHRDLTALINTWLDSPTTPEPSPA